MEISAQKPARPFGVTVVTLGVLTIACLNFIRLVLALDQWEFLCGLAGASPLYLALTGLIWTLVGWPWVYGLWRRARWAPFFTRRAVLIYTVYVWMERLLLKHWMAGQPFPPTWVFSAGFNLILVVLVFWIFSRRKTKAYFGESHESTF